jgi:hypothetical protein
MNTDPLPPPPERRWGGSVFIGEAAASVFIGGSPIDTVDPDRRIR